LSLNVAGEPDQNFGSEYVVPLESESASRRSLTEIPEKLVDGDECEAIYNELDDPDQSDSECFYRKRSSDMLLFECHARSTLKLLEAPKWWSYRRQSPWKLRKQHLLRVRAMSSDGIVSQIDWWMEMEVQNPNMARKEAENL